MICLNTIENDGHILYKLRKATCNLKFKYKIYPWVSRIYTEEITMRKYTLVKVFVSDSITVSELHSYRLATEHIFRKKSKMIVLSPEDFER